MSKHPLYEVLHPNSIAIAGASPAGRGQGFLQPLIEMGFKGDIYPVNPKYAGQDVMLHKAFARVCDIPGPVDFVISSVPSTQVLNLVDDCAAKGVKGIHFFTARFSETGRKEGVDLEKELLRRAKANNIRIIGPNCMGVYFPGWGIAFNGGMPRQSGHIGMASQSGQLTHEIVNLASTRGMYFTQAISYGNAVDFNESDYLEYFAEDAETKLILMYIEGVRGGARFFRTLRETTKKKPVVIIKGGRGDAGTRATASHTASLAGAMEIWHSMIKQTGAVEVATVEEMLDVASVFYFLPAIAGNRVGVTGGGGGGSVMAADQCEEAGLNVIKLPQEIREELKSRGRLYWDWISNPADFSIAMENFNFAEVAKLMSDHPNFDLLIMFVHSPWQTTSIDDHLKGSGIDAVNKPLCIVMNDQGQLLSENNSEFAKRYCGMRKVLIERKLPIFSSIGTAANAAAKAVCFYQNQKH